ncbi:MAG TPA: hypothetical protein VG206_12680 [Terriglobia bacterium]|nr:hypothetical protein [Terriglobia bacterium]
MAASSEAERPIKVFWPNVGGISEYPQNTFAILNFIEQSKPSGRGAVEWITRSFTVVPEFARKLLNVLRAAGVLAFEGRRYELGPAGRQFLKTKEPKALFRAFLQKVLGFREMFDLLEQHAPLTPKELSEKWAERMRPSMFADNQAPIRYNWLRGFGFASVVAHQVLLTEKGLKFASEARLAGVPAGEQRMEVSHLDLEGKMKLIGEFFEFEAKTRPSVNDALPSYALKLREGDRQLDCLWVRYVPFVGTVRFPIEVQLGGNLADSLDRLETVAQFIQRAIIVTTAEQEKQVIDRLTVKKSLLLDKLEVVLVEDVYKAVEATNVLRSLAKRLFHD